MKRTSLAIGIAMSTLVSSAAHAGCVEDSLRALIDRRSGPSAAVETNLRSSPMRPDPTSRLPSGNGARIEVLEDGTRVVSKPAVVRHPRGGELRSGDYEIAASIVDQRLGLDVAPAIVEREVDGVRRTVQAFVENAQMGGSARWHPDELGFFDYLIRNQDRNYMNYLNLNGRPVAIDNAFTFTNSQLTSRVLPDYPRIIRDLASQSRTSPAARERLRTLLPNREGLARLENTSPAEWRRLLNGRLNEEEMTGFLQRREDVLRAVADVRRAAGDDVMRAGNEPARFARTPGRMEPDAGPFGYTPSTPRSGRETVEEITRSSQFNVYREGRVETNPTLEPGVTYDVSVGENGSLVVGTGRDTVVSRGTMRITDDGAIEISGNATARGAIETSLRGMVPPGTRIQSGNRVTTAIRRAVANRVQPVRDARAVASGQRALQQTVTRLTNSRVVVRDGGFRGGIVEGPPTPGNYTIVNVRTVNRQGQAQNQTTLVQASGDVGPTATVRRLRADGEDYLPGHRTTVGNVTIGPRGEVTLTTNPQSKPGDVEILNERLRSMGIRTK